MLKIFKILLCILIFSSSNIYSQNKKKSPIQYLKIDTNNSNTQSINLEQYVEFIYTEGTKLFNNGEIPKVEPGKFKVLIFNSNDELKIVNSEELKDFDLSTIKEIKYNKSAFTKTNGELGKYIGLVIIQLK